MTNTELFSPKIRTAAQDGAALVQTVAAFGEHVVTVEKTPTHQGGRESTRRRQRKILGQPGGAYNSAVPN